jgi:transposase
MRVRCSRCGYEWETRSELKYVSCPSCLGKVQNPNWGGVFAERGRMRRGLGVGRG